MRPIVLAICCVLTGCVTYSHDGISSAIGIEKLPKACWPYDREVPINLVINNSGDKKIRFWISEDSFQSPYIVSWLSYNVQRSNGDLAIDHDPGGHGPLPQNTLEIGPGDSAKVVAYFYAFEKADPLEEFQIYLKDQADNVYPSPVFKPCRK